MKILIVGDSWGRGEWGRIPKAEVWIIYYNKLKGVDWPDGYHPNRYGLKKVFDYLIDQLN